MQLILILGLCKQAKLSQLEHRKPERVDWTTDPTNTRHQTVWRVEILVQKHNWAFFFENEHGVAVTVNCDRYQTILNEFFLTKIEEEDIGYIWFQEDGATCHTVEAILDILRPAFADRIIRRRADVVWPPRSCDLTPLGYYLWGAVKDKCYVDKP